MHSQELIKNFLSNPNGNNLVLLCSGLLIIIFVLAFIIFWFLSTRRLKTALTKSRTSHRLDLRTLNQQLEHIEAELHKKNSANERLYHLYAEQKQEIGQLTTLVQQERKQSIEKLSILENAKKELNLQFQSLAHQIFEEKNIAFSSQSKERLDSILSPFQEQLGSFKRRIDDIYHQETKERVSLKQEITQLRDLNLRINKEATNLANALKGDKKVQGNWGEMILEKVLEHSGLRKGLEYTTQGGFRGQDNQLLKPDVVVHLPEGKDIIIDSKVSLVAWEQFVNSDNQGEKEQHFSNHLGAVKAHVLGLGKKDYTNLKGLRSLDFILMFMPIEAAFARAFQADEQLFTLAFSNKIIIVSPTTLLATMRSIENIWRFDHQHRNSEEIAKRAGAIHDKLCGFAEDMEKLGKQIETVNTTYEGAMTKLTRGRGNLIAQTNRFTELGVKAKKALPRTIRETAELAID